MRESQMLALIEDYLSAVETVRQLFLDEFGVLDLLDSHRAGRIPREGWLGGKKARYTFHGVGCAVRIGGEDVDFDIGPEGRLDGFDLWRLQIFIESRKGEYPALKTTPAQEEAFAKLVKNGVISKPGKFPSPHLFYLTKIK
jgi:hypothetical protein